MIYYYSIASGIYIVSAASKAKAIEKLKAYGLNGCTTITVHPNPNKDVMFIEDQNYDG